MSPALDMSILRQVLLAYAYTIEEISGHAASSQSQGKLHTAHWDRLSRFVDAINKLPNTALPLVNEESGRVMEYPVHFDSNGKNIVRTAAPFNFAARYTAPIVKEPADSGHRHFSVCISCIQILSRLLSSTRGRVLCALRPR